MLMGMGKRAVSMRESRNPRWNRHHRIQRGQPKEAMKTRREDLDEMEMEPLMPEEEEMVELMEKRSGLTLPTPNVEDAGMLMGMGKRSYLGNIQQQYLFLADTKPQGIWQRRVCTRRWSEQVNQLDVFL